MEGHIPRQLCRGEFCSCKACGGLYSSPQVKCVILCAQTITSLDFLGNIYFWCSCLFTTPQSHPIVGHMTGMIPWKSSPRFVTRSGGKEFSILSPLDCKNLRSCVPGFAWSPSAGENKRRSRKEKWWGSADGPVLGWNQAEASPSSACSIISGHPQEHLSFMLCFVYATSSWTSDTFKEKSANQLTSYSLWRLLCIYNQGNLKQTQNISRRMKGSQVIRLKEACPQPANLVMAC